MASAGPADAMSKSAELGVLRQECQGLFERLTGVLGKVQHALHGIGGDVGRLSQLVDDVGNARSDSGALRLACSHLAEQLHNAHSAISTVDLTNAISDGLDAVETLRRECRQLNAIASMTRVTGYSVNIEAIEDYIVTLRGMIQRLSHTTTAVHEGLSSIGLAVRQATGQLGTTASCAQRAIDQQAGDQAIPVMDDICAAAVTLAEQLRESTHTNTGILMTGIQFSDAFAQRLDHIETILAAAESTPPASVLAAAQISALVSDATRMLAATREALEQLGTVGQSAVRSLTGDTGARTTKLLACWRAELDDGHQIEQLVGPALSGAMDAVRNINSSIADARENLETLSSTALEVSLATVNAGLLARRSGSAKSAMDVLSTTVRERAHACNELNGRCRTNFGRIDEITQNADFDRLTTEAGQLSELITRADADLVLAAEMFSRLEALQEAAHKAALVLQHSVDDGLHALSGLPELISRIATYAPRAGARQVSPDDAAALAPFAAIYTMDREREVHAELAGSSFPACAPITQTGEQTMDDIFF